MDSSMRLNKYLALHMGLSRREADDYIASGKVAINNMPAIIGAHVTPADKVTVNGSPITKQSFCYFALHKPVGYVCSRKRQGDAPTIYELLPAELSFLKPIGRLDKDSSGLILLSNDGDFSHRMTHPSFHKTKQYTVTLDTQLQPLHQQMISDFGIMLEDGKSQFLVTKLDEANNCYEITMSEGRNRQIRRTFAALGYAITGLHRTQFGAYALGDIKPGDFKELVISPNA